MDKSCKNCRNALKRSEFSFIKYGRYECIYECCLEENEKTPYRRVFDCCDKWDGKK